MNNLSAYLEKFRKIFSAKEAVRTAVVEVCRAQGIIVSENDVTVKERVVLCRIGPILKSELFLKKSKILSCLKERVGDAVVDIR